MASAAGLGVGVQTGSTGRTSAEFAEMAREMFARAELGDALDTVVELAGQTFHSDGVSILLANDDGKLTSAAGSDASSIRADALQLERAEGPFLTAVNHQRPVISDDLRFDSRWRFWAPLAAALGFRSVLSVGLADGDTSGSITLYSRVPSHFRPSDVGPAEVFGQHASIALAIARERQNLLKAVRARHVIGQAQGILMERYNIKASRAQTVLRGYCAHLDQDLASVAESIVRDRTLPEIDTAVTTPAPSPRQRLELVTDATEETQR